MKIRFTDFYVALSSASTLARNFPFDDFEGKLSKSKTELFICSCLTKQARQDQANLKTTRLAMGWPFEKVVSKLSEFERLLVIGG